MQSTRPRSSAARTVSSSIEPERMMTGRSALPRRRARTRSRPVPPGMFRSVMRSEIPPSSSAFRASGAPGHSSTSYPAGTRMWERRRRMTGSSSTARILGLESDPLIRLPNLRADERAQDYNPAQPPRSRVYHPVGTRARQFPKRSACMIFEPKWPLRTEMAGGGDKNVGSGTPRPAIPRGRGLPPAWHPDCSIGVGDGNTGSAWEEWCDDDERAANPDPGGGGQGRSGPQDDPRGRRPGGPSEHPDPRPDPTGLPGAERD